MSMMLWLLSVGALAGGEAREDCPEGTVEECDTYYRTKVTFYTDYLFGSQPMRVPIFETIPYELCVCVEIRDPDDEDPTDGEPGESLPQ